MNAQDENQMSENIHLKYNVRNIKKQVNWEKKI